MGAPDGEVSLSVLDRSLRLVKIPRARLSNFMWPLTRLLWFRERNSFISLTANALEASIFADASLVDSSFGSLASLSSEGGDIVIDDNIWLALQVEQHSDDWESSGARVKDISAPLAAATKSHDAQGISIMFLATRYSDFLICKEHRLPLVLRILQENGFGFAAEPDANHSGAPSPMRKRTHSPTRSSSVTGSLVLTRTTTATNSTTSSPSRPHASRDSMTSSMDSLQMSSVSEGRGRSRRTRSETADTLLGAELDSPESMPEPQADSPSPDLPRSFPKSEEKPSNGLSSEIIANSLVILPDELVTVGLATDYENIWREKLIKALFFCEDVLPPSEAPLVVDDENLLAEDDDLDRQRNSSPFSKGSAYSEASPQRAPSLLAASLAQSSISAGSEGTRSTVRPSTPASDRLQVKHPSLETAKETAAPTADAPYPVPFFGFTQTVEGASFTADIRLLRNLFPSNEEGSLVYASGDGGLSGEWLGEMVGPAPRVAGKRYAPPPLNLDGMDPSRTLLKCLQLDLSSFGLDKHGIVTAFADLLTDEGINLLYSSTFQTANIVVAKSDLQKARRVLQSHAMSM